MGVPTAAVSFLTLEERVSVRDRCPGSDLLAGKPHPAPSARFDLTLPASGLAGTGPPGVAPFRGAHAGRSALAAAEAMRGQGAEAAGVGSPLSKRDQRHRCPLGFFES